MQEAVLKSRYHQSIKKQLQEKFQYKNAMQIPKMVKVVISMGLAEASKDKQLIELCLQDLKNISGQKPISNKSKKAISNFKLRENQVIGATVTLRGERMYDFIERFAHICTPRIPDFRGFKRKGDGRGNYSLGIKDQMIFPEINLDTLRFAQGMNITFVTSATNDNECLELLSLMGLPLKSKNN
jgi:large subunit ribosomal protein L5